MGENSTTMNQPVFDTDHKFAFISGWLAVPAIASFLTFVGSIIMVTFQKPSELAGFDLFIYWTDFAFIPFLLLTYYMWIRRKKILPFLMILYFIFNAAWNISYLAAGYGIDLLNLGMSFIWIIYFIRSRRVKLTFTK